MSDDLSGDMDIKQLRVAVAQDVLKLLEFGQVEPTKMHYLTTSKKGMRRLSAKTLQQRLINDPPPCQVCALGLAAISLVRVKGRFSGRRLYDNAEKLTREQLGDEWAQIVEAAFELWTLAGHVVRSDLKQGNPSERARLIMETIIKTGGDEDELKDALFVDMYAEAAERRTANVAV